MSSKRSKVTAVAAAGTLAVAIAAGAAAATLPAGTSAASAGTADAYLAVAAGHQGATRAAQADTTSSAQLVISTERMRFRLQHSEDVAAAKAAAQAAQAARAAAAKAAAAAARRPQTVPPSRSPLIRPDATSPDGPVIRCTETGSG